MKATVLRYGPLGASVSIAPSTTVTTSPIVVVDTNQQQMGLILQDQIEYWAALNKRDPQVGEILSAYIQKVRADSCTCMPSIQCYPFNPHVFFYVLWCLVDQRRW